MVEASLPTPSPEAMKVTPKSFTLYRICIQKISSQWLMLKQTGTALGPGRREKDPERHA
uniref:Uncharacterized protein n=1 Tax=Anguilla anguilla TaxID=7936 RepID=A0A0E9VIL0_ANGAN